MPQTLRNYCIQAWTLPGSQPSRVLQSQLQPRPTVDPQLDVFDVFDVFYVFDPPPPLGPPPGYIEPDIAGSDSMKATSSTATLHLDKKKPGNDQLCGIMKVRPGPCASNISPVSARCSTS